MLYRDFFLLMLSSTDLIPLGLYRTDEEKVTVNRRRGGFPLSVNAFMSGAATAHRRRSASTRAMFLNHSAEALQLDDSYSHGQGSKNELDKEEQDDKHLELKYVVTHPHWFYRLRANDQVYLLVGDTKEWVKMQKADEATDPKTVLQNATSEEMMIIETQILRRRKQMQKEKGKTTTRASEPTAASPSKRSSYFQTKKKPMKESPSVNIERGEGGADEKLEADWKESEGQPKAGFEQDTDREQQEDEEEEEDASSSSPPPQTDRYLFDSGGGGGGVGKQKEKEKETDAEAAVVSSSPPLGLVA